MTRGVRNPNRNCTIADCHRPVYAHGICIVHRMRLRRTGRLDVKTLAERFWERVNKNGPFPAGKSELGRCWLWIGYVGNNGYGQIRWDGRRTSPHRISWELAGGNLLKRPFTLDHLCRDPRCVNPSHLEQVTDVENSRRGSYCKMGYGGAEKAKAMRKKGMKLKDIGKILGVGAPAVHNAIHGLTWARRPQQLSFEERTQ